MRKKRIIHFKHIESLIERTDADTQLPCPNPTTSAKVINDIEFKSVHLMNLGGENSIHAALLFEAKDGRVFMFRGGPEIAPQSRAAESLKYMPKIKVPPHILNYLAPDAIHRILPTFLANFLAAQSDVFKKADFGRCIVTIHPINNTAVNRPLKQPAEMTPQELEKLNADKIPDRWNFQTIVPHAGIDGLTPFGGVQTRLLSDDPDVVHCLMQQCINVKNDLSKGGFVYRPLPSPQKPIQTNCHGVITLALSMADEALKQIKPAESLLKRFAEYCPKAIGAATSKLWRGASIKDFLHLIKSQKNANDITHNKTTSKENLKIIPKIDRRPDNPKTLRVLRRVPKNSL